MFRTGKINFQKSILLLKWGLIAIVASCFIFLLPSFIRKTPTQALETTQIAFSPDNLNLEIGEETVVAIDLAPTTEASISAAQLVVNYDPTIIEVLDIQPGSFFSSYAEPLIIYEDLSLAGTIKATYSFPLENPMHSSSSPGTVALVSLKAKASGTTSLSFDTTETIITNVDSAINFNASEASINVVELTPSPSPSPSPSPIVSPSPSATPSPSPSPSPTPSPSPEPTPSPEPPEETLYTATINVLSDPGKVAIQGIEVEVRDLYVRGKKGVIAELLTNTEGQARVELPDGSYYALIKDSGFENEKVNIIIDGSDFEVDILLHSKGNKGKKRGL